MTLAQQIERDRIVEREVLRATIKTLRSRLDDPRLKMMGLSAEVRALAEGFEVVAAMSERGGPLLPASIHPHARDCACEHCCLLRMVKLSELTAP